MAAPQQVRAVPLARALRLRARASAAAPSKSPETSRRALLGLTEPELRQLAVDLGQVRKGRHAVATFPFPSRTFFTDSVAAPPPQQGYRGKQLHDLVYKNRAKQIEEFAYG
jgi:23S rRNA (adenine2503-C2)-methyltransferase